MEEARGTELFTEMCREVLDILASVSDICCNFKTLYFVYSVPMNIHVSCSRQRFLSTASSMTTCMTSTRTKSDN